MRVVKRGVMVATIVSMMLAVAPAAHAVTLPGGFQAVTVFDGLDAPAAVRFAGGATDPVFVAEKRGTVVAYSSLTDATPTTVVDLRSDVYNRDDRGLLGLAIDPAWPTRPYVYLLYTRDADIGGAAPKWGTGGDYDPCALTNGSCAVSGRLVRITVDTGTLTETQAGDRVVLVDDWCAQFSSHTIGDLRFGPGPNPQLYAGGGDGASYDDLDFGQFGTASGFGGTGNVCGDPPGGTDDLAAPSAEGGALRAQDLLTPDDPTGLSGSIIRVDPDTGDASPGNPLADSPTADANAKRIVAEGLRNPFRFTVRPGTDELWLGDVGWNKWEELNRVVDPGGAVDNFGWPCYEGDPTGSANQAGYSGAGLSLCADLYAAGPSAVVPPYWATDHRTRSRPCAVEEDPLVGFQSSANTGLAFQGAGGSYPASYTAGGLFVANYGRACIWFLPPGGNGLPDPAAVSTFADFETGTGEAGPIGVERGPGGDLYWVDIVGGRIVRADYSPDRPVAKAVADKTNGPLPLTVTFDASTSSDPQGDPLSYAWDLDGNGSYETDTGSTPTVETTYTTGGIVYARARVSETGDPSSSSESAPIRIDPGNTPPRAVDMAVTGKDGSSPYRDLVEGDEWYAGQSLKVQGFATDDEDGGTPDVSGWTWAVILRHCVGQSCHSHTIAEEPAKDTFFLKAPDHDAPSYLQLRLTVRDAGGLETTITRDLHPATRSMDLRSVPAGRTLSLGSDAAPTPWGATLIRGGERTITAAAQEVEGGRTYVFDRWNDDANAPRIRPVTSWTNHTYTAVYRSSPGVAAPTVTGTPVVGSLLTETDGAVDGTAPVQVGRVWERCDAQGSACVPISGETGTTHRVALDDIGSRLRVVVTAQNAIGTGEAASTPTAVVPPLRGTSVPPGGTDTPPPLGSGTDPGPSPTPSTRATRPFTARAVFRLPPNQRCMPAGRRLRLGYLRPKGLTINLVLAGIRGKRTVRLTGRKARAGFDVGRAPRKGFTIDLAVRTSTGVWAKTERTYISCGAAAATASAASASAATVSDAAATPPRSGAAAKVARSAPRASAAARPTRRARQHGRLALCPLFRL